MLKPYWQWPNRELTMNSANRHDLTLVAASVKSPREGYK